MIGNGKYSPGYEDVKTEDEQTKNSGFQFWPDYPVYTRQEDELENWQYAQQLAETMLTYQDPYKKSIVFGLTGPSGAGKSSIVGMTRKQIPHVWDQIRARMETSGDVIAERYPRVIEFTPWNFTGQEQLLEQFFNTMFVELRHNRFEAGKAARSLAEYAEFFTSLPKVGTTAGIFSMIGRLVQKMFGFNTAQSPEQCKEKLNKILREDNRKVIVTVDEIDQMTNEEIRQVFHLIKSMADFSNTVYLISFDKAVITRALAEVQQEKGERAGEQYLEKVVQVPFEIPLVSSQELERMLFEKLDIYFQFLPQNKWDKRRWIELYYGGEDNCGDNRDPDRGFANFFKTFRHMKRYVNSMSVSMKMVRELQGRNAVLNVNPVDFLALTAIQVFNPALYGWIRDRKDYMTCMPENETEKKQAEKDIRNEIAAHLLHDRATEEKTLSYMVTWEDKREILDQYEKDDPDFKVSLGIVEKLFPKFDPDCDLYIDNKIDNIIKHEVDDRMAEWKKKECLRQLRARIEQELDGQSAGSDVIYVEKLAKQERNGNGHRYQILEDEQRHRFQLEASIQMIKDNFPTPATPTENWQDTTWQSMVHDYIRKHDLQLEVEAEMELNDSQSDQVEMDGGGDTAVILEAVQNELQKREEKEKDELKKRMAEEYVATIEIKKLKKMRRILADDKEKRLRQKQIEWKNDLRICSPDIYETYFRLLVPKEDRLERYRQRLGASAFQK